MIRVSVLNPDNSPAMPTKASRARRWLKTGKAVIVHNDLNVFCIRLVTEPSDSVVQDVVLGIDPGSMFTGASVQTSKTTLFKGHLALPRKAIAKKMESRKLLRRARRGRRINRNLDFKLRAHREKRFSNRCQHKIAPSIKANKLMELRVTKELFKLFPISDIRYEEIKARTEKGKGRSFSPAMVGQKFMMQWLAKLAPVVAIQGWQTSILRQQLGLVKNKANKAAQEPETHANDAVAIAASHFMNFRKFQTANEHGAEWVGQVQMTDSVFRVIAKPNLYRRQLHFENPRPGFPNNRKRKGGTITPFGFRSGDLVKASKAGNTVLGWIGGFSEATKVVGVYDLNWKRLGQFKVNKVELIQRSNKLCVSR